ncbi:hypothetical protein D9756_004943 [Leucocoprinus leucothites]|uniref:Uncharacterized protein n=1 Tax=Leucocoprinus leucothites TaxID=201217 RepID=A0A8H5G9S7_9AGAR|nr:hypothetical protein D9756_004943 [Leucoagaricus leucothites]
MPYALSKLVLTIILMTHPAIASVIFNTNITSSTSTLGIRHPHLNLSSKGEGDSTSHDGASSKANPPLPTFVVAIIVVTVLIAIIIFLLITLHRKPFGDNPSPVLPRLLLGTSPVLDNLNNGGIGLSVQLRSPERALVVGRDRAFHSA